MSIQPIFQDPAHPDLPWQDWLDFKVHAASSFGISQVIDRASLSWTRVDARLHTAARAPMEFKAVRVGRLSMVVRCNSIISPLGWNPEALVHPCGASPVLTKDVEEAIFLLERYGSSAAPRGLRW